MTKQSIQPEQQIVHVSQEAFVTLIPQTSYVFHAGQTVEHALLEISPTTLIEKFVNPQEHINLASLLLELVRFTAQIIAHTTTRNLLIHVLGIWVSFMNLILIHWETHGQITV